MSITAYDDSLPLPSHSSQIISVRTASSPWPITVHLACIPSPTNSSLPTILYEPPSGIPGSLSLLDYPLPPWTDDDQPTYPGRWLLDMQKNGTAGTVCVWDRPGYGFSQILPGADLAKVSDTLFAALKSSGHVTRKSKLVLVGEGYGGLLTRVFASNHARYIHGLVHIEAQTAHTYFSENPNGRGIIGLTTHRLATRLLPSLLTPLSLVRLPSALLRRSSSLSRILANTLPPTTEYLNESLQKARLQETFSSHSHTSSSFRALLESGIHYPSRLPAVVVSSEKHMAEDPEWEIGQKGLVEEVTAPEGLLEWVKVKGVGKGVCEHAKGVKSCVDAVKRVIKK